MKVSKESKSYFNCCDKLQSLVFGGGKQYGGAHGLGAAGMCGVPGGVQAVEPACTGAEASAKETPCESRHLKSILFPLFLIKEFLLPAMHMSFVRVSFVRGWNISLN